MQATSTLNGVDLARLSATIDAVAADASLGQFQFRVGNHWIDGGHSRATIQAFFGVGQEDASRAEPFVIDTDEPPVLLGTNLAPNAGEYLLHALAACITATIAYHAAARGIALSGLECAVAGDVDLRGFLGLDPAVRPGFEQIRATVTVAGDFDDAQFAVLTCLPDFSPVRDSITNPVPVLVSMARKATTSTGVMG